MMSARLQMVLRMIVSILTPKESQEQSSNSSKTNNHLTILINSTDSDYFLMKLKDFFRITESILTSKESQEQSFKSSKNNNDNYRMYSKQWYQS